MNAPESNTWRKCTTCKKPISFGQPFWVCSVSTCNRVRTQLVFCNVGCFDAHVPVMNHRDAGAIENRAPSRENWEKMQTEEKQKGAALAMSDQPKKEVLVVISKIKDYIRSTSQMNTSEAVMAVISDKVRAILDQAIENAKADGRKTVMDRDIQ